MGRDVLESWEILILKNVCHKILKQESVKRFCVKLHRRDSHKLWKKSARRIQRFMSQACHSHQSLYFSSSCCAAQLDIKLMLREAPDKKRPGLFGHCPNGGGGLDPCPNGLGHLFWEELFMFKGAFAWFGGSEPLPGWFGAPTLSNSKISNSSSLNLNSKWYFKTLECVHRHFQTVSAKITLE